MLEAQEHMELRRELFGSTGAKHIESKSLCIGED